MAARVMRTNRKIKVVVVQNDSLEGELKQAKTMRVVAGSKERMRKDGSLLTTHQEYGIKTQIDLNLAFFTPRMSRERLRLCNLVSRGEWVLSLFSGVGMEGLMIAGRREVGGVVMVELNERAVECARRGRGCTQLVGGVLRPARPLPGLRSPSNSASPSLRHRLVAPLVLLLLLELLVQARPAQGGLPGLPPCRAQLRLRSHGSVALVGGPRARLGRSIVASSLCSGSLNSLSRRLHGYFLLAAQPCVDRRCPFRSGIDQTCIPYLPGFNPGRAADFSRGHARISGGMHFKRLDLT